MPDDLPRIFDAYYQSEPGRQRGSNGLGLALARWVIEQHGGTISAANRLEGGCCITIALLLEAAA
jgi:signal transduction histidine kinase